MQRWVLPIEFRYSVSYRIGLSVSYRNIGLTPRTIGVLGSVMDPVPHWPAVICSSVSGISAVLGMWIRIQKKGKWPNKPEIQPFKKAFVPTEVCFMTCYLHEVYFSWKNLTFCDGKVWSGSGSAWIRIGFAAWIRFCIEIKTWSGSGNEISVDPQHWF